MRQQTAYERRYRTKFKPIMTEQLKEVLYNLEAKAASLTKDFEEKLFDDAAADKLMQEVLGPVIASLTEEQGKLALAFAGDDDSEFKMTDTIRREIERRTLKMAKRFNDNTLSALNKTLTQGVADGEGLEKLKSRVEDVYASAKGYRAELIARTETLNASNNATNEAYKQTGYVKAKQWYANPGACEICEEMDGKTVALDDDFLKQGETLEYGDGQELVNSYDDVGSPPVHPNCRCTIIPVR